MKKIRVRITGPANDYRNLHIENIKYTVSAAIFGEYSGKQLKNLVRSCDSFLAESAKHITIEDIKKSMALEFAKYIFISVIEKREREMVRL